MNRLTRFAMVMALGLATGVAYADGSDAGGDGSGGGDAGDNSMGAFYGDSWFALQDNGQRSGTANVHILGRDDHTAPNLALIGKRYQPQNPFRDDTA